MLCLIMMHQIWPNSFKELRLTIWREHLQNHLEKTSLVSKLEYLDLQMSKQDHFPRNLRTSEYFVDLEKIEIHPSL
jgi:hypothetical protein